MAEPNIIAIGSEMGGHVMAHLQKTTYSHEAFFCAMGALAGEYAYRATGRPAGPPKWCEDLKAWPLLFEFRQGHSNKDADTFGRGILAALMECKTLSDFEKMSAETQLLATLMDSKTAIEKEAAPLDYISPVFLQSVWAPELVRPLRDTVDGVARSYGMNDAVACITLGFGVGGALVRSETAFQQPVLHFAKVALDFAALFSMFPPLGGFTPLAPQAAAS